MSIAIKAFSNCDDAFVVWKPTRISDCRGFALFRYRRDQNGKEKEEIVDTWVGFEDDQYKPGTQKHSTEWPIQKFSWVDYLTRNGDEVRYRVVPMCGPKTKILAVEKMASPKTPWMKIGTGQTAGFSAFFNRGIVASQWLSRRLGYIPPNEQRKKLKSIINDKRSAIRQFLAGEIRIEILKLLREAKDSDKKIYACLFELNDPELIEQLVALGKNANVILANGSPDSKHPDKNIDVRLKLKEQGKIKLYDRIVKKPHLSHHKFLVLTDKNDEPEKVWTGSTNLTVTGLCTQANNGILITNRLVASWFRDQWNLLKKAGNVYPKSLKEAGSKNKSLQIRDRRKGPVMTYDISVWFTPLYKENDLREARQIIRNAKQGILFLFFNPGPKNTLLNEIIALHRSGLFIHGVVNQDPGGKVKPVLKLYDRGNEIRPTLDALIPAAINKQLTFWQPELRNYSIAMVHSKVVIIDPFGRYPVIMTGSHNLGPKASRANDDNLIIIKNAPNLAAEYAVNIMSIYGQYKWRHNQITNKRSQRWKGLVDNDDWQSGLMKGPYWNEILFWFGQYGTK